MSYSDEFKINVNRLNSEEVVLPLLIITHPFLSTPIRLVADNKDFLFMGDNYIAMPFEIQKQDDIQAELPTVTLTFPNVGRTMVRWIDSSGGGSGSLISIILARRSDPSLIEERLNFSIDTLSLKTETVSMRLIVQNNLTKRSVKYIYDFKRAPGLF